jgi:hypothetical protein
VMEYLEGEPLSVRLARGPLPLEPASRTARDVADALAWAHASRSPIGAEIERHDLLAVAREERRADERRHRP